MPLYAGYQTFSLIAPLAYTGYAIARRRPWTLNHTLRATWLGGLAGAAAGGGAGWAWASTAKPEKVHMTRTKMAYDVSPLPRIQTYFSDAFMSIARSSTSERSRNHRNVVGCNVNPGSSAQESAGNPPCPRWCWYWVLLWRCNSLVEDFYRNEATSSRSSSQNPLIMN